MKLSSFLVFLTLLSCGPTEQEIQAQIDETVGEVLEEITTTTTTIPPTTTTISTTTTTIPRTTGIGLDENGNSIAPAIEFLEIIEPNILVNETFTIKASSEYDLNNLGARIFNEQSIKIKAKIIPGSRPVLGIWFFFGTETKIDFGCLHIFNNEMIPEDSYAKRVPYYPELKNKIYEPFEHTFYCGYLGRESEVMEVYSPDSEGEYALSHVELLVKDEYDNIIGETGYWNKWGIQKEFINKIVLFNKNSKTVLSDSNFDTTELLPPDILFKLEIGS